MHPTGVPCACSLTRVTLSMTLIGAHATDSEHEWGRKSGGC